MRDSDSVYEYFQYLWIIKACLGLSNRKIKECSRKPSKFVVLGRYLYNIVFLTTAAITLYFGIRRSQIQYDTKLLPQFANVIMLSSSLYAAVIAFCVNLYYQDELHQTLKEIHTTERRIMLLGGMMSYKNEKLYLAVLLTVSGIYWMIHFTFYNFIFDKSTTIRDFLHWSRIYVPFVVNSIYIVQFTGFGLALAKLYTIVNDLLENGGKASTGYKIAFLEYATVHMERTKALQLLYNKLYKISIAINDIHSFPLLVMFGMQFINIFACTYFCIFGYIYKDRYVKPQSFSEYLVPIIPSCPAFLQFITIVAVSERVAKRKKVIERTIYKLSSCNDMKMKQWVRYEKSFFWNTIRAYRLQGIRFSLQLIHQRKYFTAYGFFDINLNLFITVILRETLKLWDSRSSDFSLPLLCSPIYWLWYNLKWRPTTYKPCRRSSGGLRADEEMSDLSLKQK